MFLVRTRGVRVGLRYWWKFRRFTRSSKNETRSAPPKRPHHRLKLPEDTQNLRKTCSAVGELNVIHAITNSGETHTVDNTKE